MHAISNNDNIYDAIFAGGGAASFFAALRCSEIAPGKRYAVLEKGKQFLQKVLISGGGRCNVTNVVSEPIDLIAYYPRGNKALLGPFHAFSSADTVRWFENRGIKIKAESDGRMFPLSNRSSDIANTLLNGCEHAGIDLFTSTGIKNFEWDGEIWTVYTNSGMFQSRLLFLGAGSSPAMWQLLKAKGVKIVPPVPSLFTFNIADKNLHALAGLSVPHAEVKILHTKLQASGPLLITHWGLSGPAILRLSAWGARDLAACNYQFEITVNWIAETPFDEWIAEKRNLHGKEKVHSRAVTNIPLRLWKYLLDKTSIGVDDRWADINKAQWKQLQQAITACTFKVHGKSTFKEEFVTAGGVDLKEVNFKTFSSKHHPNLYWAGEILDIDGITGGFNFQAAWTGAYLAGSEMGRKLLE